MYMYNIYICTCNIHNVFYVLSSTLYIYTHPYVYTHTLLDFHFRWPIIDMHCPFPALRRPLRRPCCSSAGRPWPRQASAFHIYLSLPLICLVCLLHGIWEHWNIYGYCQLFFLQDIYGRLDSGWASGIVSIRVTCRGLNQLTLWSFNIASEHGPFIVDLPLTNNDFP